MSDLISSQPPQASDFTFLDPNDRTFTPAEQEPLGQAEFFKLLTTQLASQDPLEPMDDTAFIAQMANFSELEMMSSLNDNFSEFTSLQQFQASQGYIGKKVTMLVDGADVTGIANGIEYRDGDTKIFVDGNEYDMSLVYKIEQP